MEDTKIIDLYFARTERAIDQTAQKYGPYCGQIAWQILHSREDSDECVNDTWLRAWNAMPPRRPSCLRTFLGKITRNLALDRWDRRHADKRGGGQVEILLSELGDCIPSVNGVERELEGQEIADAISGWLRCQPERHRRLFLRRYFFADSLPDAAHDAGLSVSAAKSALFRLRGSLREHLEQEGIAL